MARRRRTGGIVDVVGNGKQSKFIDFDHRVVMKEDGSLTYQAFENTNTYNESIDELSLESEL